MRAPIADYFSLLPQILVEQAFHTDYAWFPTPEGEICLAYWMRVAKVDAQDGMMTTGDGKTFGVELVAYPCDCRGRVFDWERRYEVQTTAEMATATAVICKLKMLIANDLAPLCNYEGLLEELESAWAGKLDWDEMPNNLQ